MTGSAKSDNLLGDSLKKARINAGLTQEQLAEQAGWEKKTGKAKASKLESGRQLPSEDDLTAWAAATGVDDRLRTQWVSLAAQAESTRTASYKRRLGGGMAAVQKGWDDEAKATSRFRFFETFVIPRYLQVPEYSRAILEEYDKHYSLSKDLDTAVGERLSSGRHLYDATKSFSFLIDEPVLFRTRFPAAVMRPQLHALQAAIGLTNVRIGIYPSLSLPVSRLTPSSVELLDDGGYIETALGGATRLLYDSVAELEETLASYWQDAVEGDDARGIILRALAALPTD